MSNLSGIIIGKSFLNDHVKLGESLSINISVSKEPVSKYYEGLLDNQLDIGFKENISIIFLNDIRKIKLSDLKQLSRCGQILSFAMSDTAGMYMFESFLDGVHDWDDYIRLGDDGKLESINDVIQHQNRDILIDVFPALIKQLFNTDLESLLNTDFKRFTFINIPES